MVISSNKWYKTKNQKLIKEKINNSKPDIICFTSVFSQFEYIKTISQFIKFNWPNKFQILGGAHASLQPEIAIQAHFNAICIGEGEYPLLDLCNAFDAQKSPYKIKNLWIKDEHNKIHKNPTRPFLENLDSLPFPDREIWRPWIHNQQSGDMAILLGRGCPFNCTYCSNHALKKLATGKYVRMRSPENIIAELKYIYKNFSHKNIYFEVETITAYKTWTLDFCKQLEKFNKTINNHFIYGCNFRVTPKTVDEDFFISFEKANIKKINIGLESGSARIRKEILNRNYSNEDFLNTVALAKKHHIQVYIYNMIGLPTETWNDYLDTVALNRKIQPDGLFTSIFFPYIGTKIYDYCQKNNLISSSKHQFESERRRSVLKLKQFSKHQRQNAYLFFDFRIYKGYKPRIKLLLYALLRQIRSYETFNYILRNISNKF